MSALDPAVVVAETVRRIEEEGRVVSLHMSASRALALIGELQLVLRHPDITGPMADVARAAVAQLAEQIPELADIVELGFDEDLDVPVRRCRSCGCTEHNACEGGCSWVADDLCSRCADRAVLL